MKYAILNGKRVEPQKGITDAICPICGETVIPKCGNVKIHHWAHKTKNNCDPWWENETIWHRQWKDLFPKECQEVIMHDKVTGEKHIADVHINNNLTIEFQHSSMSTKEQSSREKFYKNMIWVVDANKYYEKFKSNLEMLNYLNRFKDGFYTTIEDLEYNQYCFPKRWLTSTVPVVFDFGINEDIKNDFDKQKKWLYCIFPKKLEGIYVITICGVYFTKKQFINKILSNNFLYKDYEKLFLSEIEAKYRQEEEKRTKELNLALRRQKEEKYSKEKVWRDAIVQLCNDIKIKKVKPIKLKINYQNGEIVDINGLVYNNEECMVLAINSFSEKYKNNLYNKNIGLLLIKNEDKIIPALINLKTYIVNGGKSEDFYGILYGKYNYYIRTITTMPYYNKYIAWFENADRIYSTKNLKKCLDDIKNEFKLL